jgi:hypothetical protein
MNFNVVRGKFFFLFFFHRKYKINLETGWTHDVAFSPSGENLAWVSHNSIIFAVSSNNPTRFVLILNSEKDNKMKFF